MKLSSKLYACVAVLLLIGLLVAGLGVRYLRVLGEQLETAVKMTAVRIDKVDSIRARSWQMVASMRGVAVFASANDTEMAEASAKEFETAHSRLRELFGELSSVLVSDDDHRMLNGVETLVTRFEAPAADYVRLSREGQFGQAAAYGRQVFTFAANMDGIERDFRTRQMTLLKESAKRADALRSESAFVSTLLCCSLVALGGFVVLAVRRIVRDLARADWEISEGAEQVAAAASQISSASQSLAKSSSDQAASLEQTSSSNEEINSMARQNSANSRDAAALVQESQERIAATNNLLNEMVEAIGEINSHSDKISKIIRVIDEIAFQTNILALNAAVEAARAGEAGMGFAVVADEVRNLAQRSASAARDTAALIEESIASSSVGKTKVDQVASAIRTMTADSTRVKTLVDEVNLGSQEQARGIDQIGKALTHMEHLTQNTAAAAEQSAAAAVELTAQSESLKQIVARLTDMVGAR